MLHFVIESILLSKKGRMAIAESNVIYRQDVDEGDLFPQRGIKASLAHM